MITQKRSATILTLGIIAVVLAGGLCAHAGEDETVLRIRDLWKERQQLWDRIYFECSANVRWREGAVAGVVGNNPEQNCPTQLKLWVDLNANRVRRECERELFSTHLGQSRFCKRFDVFLYDGGEIQTYEPREKNSSEGCEQMAIQPELYLRPGESVWLAFEADQVPILMAIGNLIANPKNWRLPVEEGTFSPINTIQRDNRECHVLRSLDATGSESFRELWVDLERGGAVVHETMYVNGKPVQQIDINYRKLHGAWLPSDWTASHLRPDGSLWRTAEWNVDRVDVNLDLSGTDFHMEPAVGMVVEDCTLPGIVRWVLNADGTKEYLELQRPRGDGVLPGTAALAAPIPWYRRWGLVFVNGAVLLGLAFVWAHWRRRREKH